MTRLEIRDGTDIGPLTVDLKDFIAVIGVDGVNLHWRIESIEGVARSDSGLNMLNLERRVASAPGGLSMTWGELSELADSLHQTINCRIVSDSYLSIEADDSTRWILSFEAGLTPIIERCRKRFRLLSELK